LIHRIRVIPTLLLDNDGLYKTTKFKNPRYVGDPINAVRIFNSKSVDELILLDYTATNDGRVPNFENIREIVSEAFMPIGYGGGIQSIDHIEKLFKIGIEKVILNSAAFSFENLLTEAINIFGSQSIVVSIDYKKDIFGNNIIYTNGGRVKQKIALLTACKNFQNLGIGEIMINSIDREGTMNGYDLDTISKITHELLIPVIASGGAGNVSHLADGAKAGASAVAAGSMFIFQGIHKAVLLSYITSEEVINYNK
jgi:imidazole glycerol-phosphate synthase subunit HisF